MEKVNNDFIELKHTTNQLINTTKAFSVSQNLVF